MDFAAAKVLGPGVKWPKKEPEEPPLSPSLTTSKFPGKSVMSRSLDSTTLSETIQRNRLNISPLSAIERDRRKRHNRTTTLSPVKASTFKIAPLGASSGAINVSSTDVSHQTDSFGHGSALLSIDSLLDFALPPTKLPEELHAKFKHAEHSSQSSAKDRCWRATHFSSFKPTGRRDVEMVRAWLQEATQPANLPLETVARCAHLMEAYSMSFHEILRQVSVHCVERGRLLAEIWVNQNVVVNSLLKRLDAQKSAFEAALLKVQDQNQRLLNRLVVSPDTSEILELQKSEINRLNTRVFELEMECNDFDVREHAVEKRLQETEQALRALQADIHRLCPHWDQWVSLNYNDLELNDFLPGTVDHSVQPTTEFQALRTDLVRLSSMLGMGNTREVCALRVHVDNVVSVVGDVSRPSDREMKLNQDLAVLENELHDARLTVKDLQSQLQRVSSAKQLMDYDLDDVRRQLQREVQNSDVLRQKLKAAMEGAPPTADDDDDDDDDAPRPDATPTKTVKTDHSDSPQPPPLSAEQVKSCLPEAFRELFVCKKFSTCPKDHSQGRIPQPILMAMINSIYMSKIEDDSLMDERGVHRQAMPMYTYSWFLNKFGSIHVSEKLLLQFLVGVKNLYPESRLVLNMARFLGIAKPLPRHALDIYLFVLNLLWESDRKSIAFTADDGKVWVHTSWAVSQVKYIFPYINSDDAASLQANLESSSFMDTLPNQPNDWHAVKKIEFELLQEVVIEQWKLVKRRLRGRLEKAFYLQLDALGPHGLAVEHVSAILQKENHKLTRQQAFSVFHDAVSRPLGATADVCVDACLKLVPLGPMLHCEIADGLDAYFKSKEAFLLLKELHQLYQPMVVSLQDTHTADSSPAFAELTKLIELFEQQMLAMWDEASAWKAFRDMAFALVAFRPDIGLAHDLVDTDDVLPSSS